jgi:hypothetical protein
MQAADSKSQVCHYVGIFDEGECINKENSCCFENKSIASVPRGREL